jgi:hypothetical protein
LSEKLNIVILDVTPIAAKMHGDSICSCLFANHGGGNNARLRRPSRLSNGSDVIDIDV